MTDTEIMVHSALVNSTFDSDRKPEPVINTKLLDSLIDRGVVFDVVSQRIVYIDELRK